MGWEFITYYAEAIPKASLQLMVSQLGKVAGVILEGCHKQYILCYILNTYHLQILTNRIKNSESFVCLMMSEGLFHSFDNTYSLYDWIHSTSFSNTVQPNNRLRWLFIGNRKTFIRLLPTFC